MEITTGGYSTVGILLKYNCDSIYEFQNSDLYIKTAKCKRKTVHKLNSEKKRELGFAINNKISNVTYDPGAQNQS